MINAGLLLTIGASKCPQEAISLQIDPVKSDLAFKAQTGQIAVGVITIKNLSQSSLLKLSFESDDNSFAAVGGSCLKGIEPGASCEFAVQFKPTVDLADKNGSAYKRVQISINGETLKFGVDVKQYGSQRTLSLPQNLQSFRNIGSNNVRSIFADTNGAIYAATEIGLSISKDRGHKWITLTTADGLGSNSTYGVFAIGRNIYVATDNGISISVDDGITWVNRTHQNGLGNDTVLGVAVVLGKIYAATLGGLAISGNDGQNWTRLSGPPSNVFGVFAEGSNVYAATDGGISISNNNGLSWVDKTELDGLADNLVNAVYANGAKILAATNGGLSVSANSGQTWTNHVLGWAGNPVYGASIGGGIIFAATNEGLFVSANDGKTWIKKGQAEGLPSDSVLGVFADGVSVYAATKGGVGISADAGQTWRVSKR